jgi:hypothetical protein
LRESQLYASQEISIRLSFLCVFSPLAFLVHFGILGGGMEVRIREAPTSETTTPKATQSTLGKTLYMSLGFNSMVSDTSSQSLGCKGKDSEEDLQAFTAQVRKLRVKTFIFACCVCDGGERRWFIVWKGGDVRLRLGNFFFGVEIRLD